MNKFATWMKDNPLILVSIIFVLGAIGYIAVQVLVLEPSWREQVVEDYNIMRKITAIENTQVDLPGKKAGDPRTKIKLIPNTKDLEDLSKAFDESNKDHDAIIELLTNRNIGNLKSLLIPGVFPDFQGSRQQAILESRPRAKQKLQQAYNTLSLGSPLDDKALENAIEVAAQSFKENHVLENQDMTDDQRARMARELAGAQLRALRENATKFKVYGPSLNIMPLEQNLWEEGLLTPVPGWLRTTATDPRNIQLNLFDTQLQIWMIYDLFSAIDKANAGATNVMESAVKRVVSMSMPAQDFGTSGGFNATRTLAKQANIDLTKSLTGRTSNMLYLVRNIELVVVLDKAHKDKFFKAIAEQNLMTPIIKSVRDVNELDALEDNYYYGQSDTVEISMTIETVWLTGWLKEYMPTPILQRYKLKRDAPTPGS